MKNRVITVLVLFLGLSFCMGQNVQEMRQNELRYQNAIESAQKNFNQRNYEAAKQDYQTAIKLKPENAEFINEIIAEIDKLIRSRTSQSVGKVESNTERQNTALQRYTGTKVSGATLAAKLIWLQRNVESHSTYIVEVNANESIAPSTLVYRGAINVTIVLIGDDTNRTIRLSSHGTMFTVSSDVTFILENNITLQGHSGNTGAMVNVSGGIFKMNEGSTIIGNADRGVYVQWGTFEMNGGIISGNSGGGVSVGGVFTMNGGIIFGNTATNGGGVLIERNRTFTMTGGTISGNTATKSGGGVYTSGIFTMRGGTITSNTAAEYGGGVMIAWGTHQGKESTKTGGVITGYKTDPDNGNVVKDASGVIARRGHAVYINDNKRRETTAGIRVNLSGNDSANWEQ